MAAITNRILDGTGSALSGIRVTARLKPSGAFVISTGSEVAPVVTTTTDANGDWSLSLYQNTLLEPSGTYWEIEEFLPSSSGGPRLWPVTAGAAPQTVYAALASPLPAGTSATFLTQAAADARYVQAPGSFATGTADTRPNDTATAGVLSTYSRGDHRHDREITYGTSAARAALSGTDLYEGLRFRETDGNDALYERRSSAWLQVSDVLIVANAAARAAITTPYEGMLVCQSDTDRLFRYTGSLWAGVKPAGLDASGSALANTSLTVADTDTDWGSPLVFTNPGVPVNIIASVCGYASDFTAITITQTRVGISIDGGSSYTFGTRTRLVEGQGGSNYNSQNTGAQHFRSAVTPTGDIYVKAQAQNNSTTSAVNNGVLIVTIVPA